MNIPPTLRRDFEGGYRPSDDPPGLEKQYYQQWLAEREGRDKPEGPCNTQSSPRPNARQMLAEAVRANEETSRGLQALRDALPMKLPPTADDALCRLLALYRSHQ